MAPLLVRPLPLLLLAALFASGCSSSSIQVRTRPGDPVEVQAAAVYPFQFRWDEPAHRAFELSQLLAMQVAATGRYAVFGPGEFKLVRAGSDHPFLGSDFALELAGRGLSPLAALVFRPSAERRTQSEVKQVFDLQGRPQGAERIERVTVVARLEVFHSAERATLIELTRAFELDPLAARDDSDPLPALTATMRGLMARALEVLEGRAPGRLVERDAGFEFLWNPTAALDFQIEGRPPLRARLAVADPLERELLLEARVRFFHPRATPAQLVALKRLPGGLYVTEVGAAAANGLRPGDLVTAVAGEPALPQTLQRALRDTAPGGAVALAVRRGSQDLEISLIPP
jgi:hypothetical protein